MAFYTTQIIEALKGVIRSNPSKSGTGDGPWTKAIKAALEKQARNNGFITRPGAGGGKQHGELCFDHVWLERDGTGVLLDVPFAMECELNTEVNKRRIHQQEDFEKLLASRSRYRLFICQLDPKNIKGVPVATEEVEMLNRLTSMLLGYKNAHIGEVFLIVILKHRADPKSMFYRELVCGHSGWSFSDGRYP